MTDAFSKWFESAAVAGRSWTNRELAEGAFRAGHACACLTAAESAAGRGDADALADHQRLQRAVGAAHTAASVTKDGPLFEQFDAIMSALRPFVVPAERENESWTAILELLRPHMIGSERPEYVVKRALDYGDSVKKANDNLAAALDKARSTPLAAGMVAVGVETLRDVLYHIQIGDNTEGSALKTLPIIAAKIRALLPRDAAPTANVEQPRPCKKHGCTPTEFRQVDGTVTIFRCKNTDRRCYMNVNESIGTTRDGALRAWNDYFTDLPPQAAEPPKELVEEWEAEAKAWAETKTWTSEWTRTSGECGYVAALKSTWAREQKRGV